MIVPVHRRRARTLASLSVIIAGVAIAGVAAPLGARAPAVAPPDR